MAIEEAVQMLAGWLGRLSGRSDGADTPRPALIASHATRPSTLEADAIIQSKALPPFLRALGTKTRPIVLELGPVVGANIAFLGERFGCKIVCEDLFGELDRCARRDQLTKFPTLAEERLAPLAGTIDAILCWNLFDFLEREAARRVAGALQRALREDGVLLAFFGMGPVSKTGGFSRFAIVDESTLQRQMYPTAASRTPALTNREISQLLGQLRVSDSYLLKNQLREMVFRRRT